MTEYLEENILIDKTATLATCRGFYATMLADE
jgi:hypothetical protein